jgi:hypothetical protein
MAQKLYIFGIGGTGSRVIKSLSMLLAAGCRLANGFDTVVPVIIDPDTGNGDLDRTKDILRLYQQIRNQVDHPDDFFGQEMKTIHELADHGAAINPDFFQFRLNGVDGNSFRKYIGFDELGNKSNPGEDDRHFIRLLWSEANLDADISVGFKGNPHMGSVVLNQFTASEDFRRFGQTFAPGDAIFIINSIFGGTGAAGFPLLLKNLRGNSELPHRVHVKEASIGAITYLPYFSLNRQEEINSETFEEKAKIALDYYNRTIISQNRVNALYLAGNKSNTNVINYAVGGKEQKNNAHFLELAGALAIMDFCRNTSLHGVSDGRAVNGTRVKEFGIENETESVGFGDLNLDDVKSLSGPLTKYRLFTEYLEKGLPRALGVSRWTRSNIRLVPRSNNSLLDKSYFNSVEYNLQVKAFNAYFSEWIRELGDNKPAFVPFREVTADTALNLVRGTTPKGNLSFKALDARNCQLIARDELRGSAERKHTTLVKLFGRSTEKVLSDKELIIR